MPSCCEDKSADMTAMHTNHKRILWIVLVLNAVMFGVESWAGLLAHSTSLLADALDMLGDALVYGFSLFVLMRSARWQAGVALAKGGFMLAFGLGVLGEALYKMFHPVMPGVEMMGLIGGLALVANLGCFFLLYRCRSDNLNMHSTWLCSRNDLSANIGVIMAAISSYLFTSRWPDMLVGVAIASVCFISAWHVLRQSMQALRTPLAVPKPITIHL